MLAVLESLVFGCKNKTTASYSSLVADVGRNRIMFQQLVRTRFSSRCGMFSGILSCLKFILEDIGKP
jgi:hypothetical protein